jgi:hypothetical protein
MAKTLKITLLMLLTMLAVFGCHDQNRQDREAVADMEKLIQQNLKPGDPDAKIEAFFKQHNLSYAFDRFNQGYESGVRLKDRKIESVVTICIYVNPDRSFNKAEVRMSYTYL